MYGTTPAGPPRKSPSCAPRTTSSTTSQSAPSAPRAYDRVITLTHGGSDGPLFDGDWSQIGWNWPSHSGHSHDDYGNPDGDPSNPSNTDAIIKLGSLIQSAVKPDGFAYIGQCHAGTETEIVDNGSLSYVQLISCLSNRTAYGTISSSACWDVTRRVEALDGPQVALTAMLQKVTPASVPPQESFICAQGSARRPPYRPTPRRSLQTHWIRVIPGMIPDVATVTPPDPRRPPDLPPS